jgi:hypothetical protein
MGCAMHYSTGIGTLSIILLAVAQSFADATLLVDQGQPLSCIVLPAALTDERVLTAAKELAGYVEQMSGALPLVQRDDEPGDGFRILIGSTKLAAVDPASISEEKVGLDGFIIKSVPNGVAITGNTDLATANGVYHFSEEVLGGHRVPLACPLPPRPQTSLPETDRSRACVHRRPIGGASRARLLQTEQVPQAQPEGPQTADLQYVPAGEPAAQLLGRSENANHARYY